jgi:hypothetical protein
MGVIFYSLRCIASFVCVFFSGPMVLIETGMFVFVFAATNLCIDLRSNKNADKDFFVLALIVLC